MPTIAISIRHVRAALAPLRTNTVSNTAFRGFGGPQGMVGAERIIEEVAYATGQGPARNPQAQFLWRRGAQYHALSPDGRGQHHPQIIAELERRCDYAARRGDPRLQCRKARSSSAASR
jgi:xanthine dehydrogenase large subunit